MAAPADYVREAAAVGDKNKVAMLIAALIAIVIVAAPQHILGRVLGGISYSFYYLWPALGAISALLWGIMSVSYVKLAMRVRRGEAVEFADVLKVQEFAVPAALIGAPVAALHLVGYLALVAGIFGTIVEVLARSRSSARSSRSSTGS